MDSVTAATIGANLEANFNEYVDYPANKKIPLEFNIPGSEPDTVVAKSFELKVLKVMEFETQDQLYSPDDKLMNVTGAKGIILQDQNGNIYVHFNGTGDGKWGYNSANYGGPPSEIQTDSLVFFNDFIENEYQGGNIYVSGHSQGGNTAQYVTFNSPYADYVDICTSLDGPRMSNDAADAVINKYGEAFFRRQQAKMYGYYGEHDYVSPLGQNDSIPEDHISYVKNEGGDFHMIDGMMTGNDLNLILTEGSAFRDLVVALNKKIILLPPEDQAAGAALAMKIAEFYLGDNYTTRFTQEELDQFKDLLLPLLVEFVGEHPEMIYPALISIGMDEESARLIEKIIYEFNTLPEDQRTAILEALAECITVTEDGKLDFTADVKSIIEAVVLALPTIWEVIKENPALLVETLKQLGIDKLIFDFLTEHPMLAAGIALILGLTLPRLINLLKDVVALGYLIEGIYALVETIENLCEEVKNFIRNTFNAILETIGNLTEYLRRNSPGGKYVGNHPQFSADTNLLREYANRLRTVNSRLASLDRALNDLYLQVGLLDIDDILRANLVIGHSWRISKCQTYLNTAADTLETADQQALGYLGG